MIPLMRATLVCWFTVAGILALAPGHAETIPLRQTVRPGFFDRIGQKLIVQDKEALEFNEQLILALNELKDGLDHWRKAVGESLSLQASEDVKPEEITASIKEVQKAQTELIKAAQVSIGRTKKLTVHPSKSGKAFFDAQVQFLESQRKLFETDFSEVVKLVEDTGKKVQDRIKSIREIMGKAAAAEKAQLTELLKLQAAFGREFNID